MAVRGRNYQPNNPNFPAVWQGDPDTVLTVYAVIENESSEWDEPFKVSSMDKAEEEIVEVIEFYNDTMRLGDKPRMFVRIGRTSDAADK